MMDAKIQDAVSYVKSKLTNSPRIGIILGSGLGGLADRIENKQEIPYGDIPHFVTATAPGHKGQLVGGTIAGAPVLCMQGRLHFYEGHRMEDIVFPIRVMRALGVETLIVTNASGGINRDFQVGDLMLICDHINFMGTNPLIGPNNDAIGPRFNDMTYAYTPELRSLAKKAADELGVSLREGVYLGCTGPSFETPAEIRAFRVLGADAVGMSTVPDVIAAAHCGLKVLAFSLITNMAAGVLDKPIDGKEVDEVGQRRGRELQSVIVRVISKLDK